MDASRARRLHEDRLLALPNVTGVGTGKDERTGEDVVVAFVGRKVPVSQLRPEDVIPAQVEGVPVRVREIGEVSAQDA